MLRQTGRLIGLLSLTQIVLGIVVNFVLTAPLTDPSGPLLTAADHAQAIGVSALLGLLNGLLGIGIAVLTHAVTRQRAPGQGTLLIAVAAVVCAAAVAEQAQVMSLVSLSQAYAAADAGGRATFPAMQSVVESSRNWSHLAGLIMAGATVVVYYGLLFRRRLVPRLLAGLGLTAGALEILAVALPFFGGAVEFLLLMPMALVEIAAAGWLIARGFSDRSADAP